MSASTARLDCVEPQSLFLPTHEMQINRINILGDSFLTKPMPLRSSNDEGVRHEDERLSISPVPNAQRRFKFEAYGLLTTTFGAGLETCSWALTFWICAACSLSCAIKTSIPFCCCATVPSKSWTFLCFLRNSLSNIAFTASYRTV